MNIRLLPMSKQEFAKIEDVLHFLIDELSQRGGKYYFRRRSMVYKEDIIVAFQYDSKIVASAILVGQSSDGKYENGVEYMGYYQFEINSFVICEKLIRTKEIKNLMPEFKGFNQSTQFLTHECIRLIR